MAPATFGISAYSQVMPTYQSPSKVPTITVNGNPFPQPPNPPSNGSGFQVVVLDATMDLTSPSAIRTNQYAYLYDDNGSWMSVYPYMYANIVRQILSAGNPQTQIVIVASWGLDANLPPTNDALELFLDLGAGKDLQTWETTVDVGSQSGQWTGYPAAYILVGNPAYSWGEGAEDYERATSGDSVTAAVEVTLGR